MTKLLEENLIELTKTENWREILKISQDYELVERSKFLWAWPTIDCLEFLKTVLVKNNIGEILSIGCGSGLLEWIINKSTGLCVSGVELDNSWWRSVYSPKTFIKLNFVNGRPLRSFLLNSTQSASSLKQVALLFCYFNNREAFLDYIEAFDGDVVIIVGPGEGCGIVTEPRPFQPDFDETVFKWELIGKIRMETTNNLAIYKRYYKK